MKIYSLGSLNIDYVYSVDHFVSAGETLSSSQMNTFAGGKGLNQSVALARAGANVLHGAVLGNGGELLESTLKNSGVNTERINKADAPCGHAIIQVDKNGQNCILLFAGTNHLIDREYIENFLFDAEKDDILVLQNEVNNLALIFEIANEKGMQIAFNPSPFDENILKLPLNFVKWFFVNEIEAAALFKAQDVDGITENFRKQFPESRLILTLGEKGSVYVDANERIEQPIFKVKAVDTTAAGDTFTGYFLATVSKGKPIKTALEMASKASSITVSRNGASQSIPFLNEVTL